MTEKPSMKRGLLGMLAVLCASAILLLVVAANAGEREKRSPSASKPRTGFVQPAGQATAIRKADRAKVLGSVKPPKRDVGRAGALKKKDRPDFSIKPAQKTFGDRKNIADQKKTKVVIPSGGSR